MTEAEKHNQHEVLEYYYYGLEMDGYTGAKDLASVRKYLDEYKKFLDEIDTLKTAQ